MRLAHRSIRAVLALAVLFCLIPLPARAEGSSPAVIESEVLLTADLPEEHMPYGLTVQATSVPGLPYRYVLTVVNLSEWPINSLHVLDRYFSANPDQEEIAHQWFPQTLESGQAASRVIDFPDGPLSDGCHQIEINLADGLGTILMDCNGPGTTTIWNIPLTQESAAYLSKPALTRSEPTGGSKLGIHLTRNSSPTIMEFVREAHPAVVVSLGDMAFLADVKTISPQTVTIGRFLEGDQSLEGDPTDRARQFVNDNASRYLESPGVDYWLGWNEPTIGSVADMEWFAAFESERTVAMAEVGLKVAVGNFSVGTPELSEFEAFLPALATAKEHQGILALHEYSAPTMYSGLGAGIPGLEASDERGALTLRYRYWYDHYLQAHDLVLPLVITEAGLDGGVIPSGEYHTKGWRDLSEEILSLSPEDATESYLAQLNWYDDQLRRDSQVLGFAIFNVGDSEGMWKSFDVTDILPRLAEVIYSKECQPKVHSLPKPKD